MGRYSKKLAGHRNKTSFAEFQIAFNLKLLDFYFEIISKLLKFHFKGNRKLSVSFTYKNK